MIKQLILITFFFASTLFVTAQTYMGIIGGVNRATIHSVEGLNKIRPVTRAVFGFSSDVYISRKSSLSFSLLFDNKGYSRYLDGVTVDNHGVNRLRYSYSYVTLPAIIKVEGEKRFFFSGGFGVYASVLYNTKVTHFLYGQKVYEGRPIKQPSKNLDAGLIFQFGLGYHVNDRVLIRTQFNGILGLVAYYNNEDFTRRDSEVINLAANTSLGLLYRISKSKK